METQVSGPMSPKTNLVVVSDMHVGCRLGLCGPAGAQLDDGGEYKPSSFQRKLWRFWERFWREFVPEVTQGEPFDVVVNGDALDGVHHGSVTQWSHNMQDQIVEAENILLPVLRAGDGRYFHVRGTEAHVGKSAQYEEILAAGLGAERDEEGRAARYELWYQMASGALIHLLHHVGTTSSMAYEATALSKEMAELNNECARWGLKTPDVLVRSHRHRHIEVRLPASRTTQIAVVTPGWQGKTPFAWKIAGARISVPQFGGVVIRQAMRDSQPGDLYTRAFVMTPSRSKVVR